MTVMNATLPFATTLPPRINLNMEQLERLCIGSGYRMTGPRRLIAEVLERSDDHPDVEEIHRRAKAYDPRISAATIYRTVKLFEDLKLIVRHRFGDGPARYELAQPEAHDHLIDVESGRVIEFRDTRIDAIQSRLAEELGYEILSYKLEIFAIPARKAS